MSCNSYLPLSLPYLTFHILLSSILYQRQCALSITFCKKIKKKESRGLLLSWGLISSISLPTLFYQTLSFYAIYLNNYSIYCIIDITKEELYSQLSKAFDKFSIDYNNTTFKMDKISDFTGFIHKVKVNHCYTKHSVLQHNVQVGNNNYAMLTISGVIEYK